METPEKLNIQDIGDVELYLNALYRRLGSMREDLDMMAAKLDLATTPFWHFKARRLTKHYIDSLEDEHE